MRPQLMTSSRDDYETPNEIYKIFDDVFHFSLDSAADQNNTKCDLFIDKEQNTLTTDWKEYLLLHNAETNTVWLNPPYGAKILLPFLKKVEEEYKKGLTICVLTAARTDTRWFRIIWENARYLTFIYKRIKFELNGQSIGSATFPSVVSIFTSDRWNLWKLNSIGHLMEQQIITPQELRTLP